MPPKKRIEATVYIIDCSSNVKERLSLLYRIHALKLFAQTKGATKDFQQIILYNHPGLKPKHVVNEWMYYSFDLLKTIKTQIEEAHNDYVPHNFLFVLNGALDAFTHEYIKPEYIKRIVFITDLSSKIEFDKKTEEKIQIIKDQMLEEQIWLYVIGLPIKLPLLFTQHEISKLNKIEPIGEISPEQKNNFVILSRFDTNAVFVDEEHGIDVIFAHKVEPKLPFYWYVKMNIGPDLEFPVMIYRTTRSPEIIKFHPCPLEDSQAVSSTKVWYDVNTHETVSQSDVVKGFKFQGKFVQATNEQFANAKEHVTQKCLTIFGFAKMDEVPINVYEMEDSVNCIKPDSRSPQSSTDRSFDIFVTSLRVKNSVALAYRVYNSGNSRRFFCIFPCPEHKSDGHLLMAQFPYYHEIKENYVKGKIEDESCKSDAYNMMKDFLDTLEPFDEKHKQDLYPLPPSMQVSRSRGRKTEMLVCSSLGEDPGESPELTMHPVLEKRASKCINELLKEVLLN